MLDAHGCELRCSVMSDASQENQFIVARKEVSVHNLFYLHLLCQDLWSYPVVRCHAARQEILGLISMEKSTMYKLLISLRRCLLFFIKISFGCRPFISIKLMEEVRVWHLKVETVLFYY
mgnify:CR=1 FL=1